MANIVLLEDDPEIAFRLRQVLEDEGHEVRWVHSATAASLALAVQPADLVIADIYVVQDGRMTADGGLSLIGALRTQEQSADNLHMARTPVIAISGASARPGHRHILDIAQFLGADFVLAKPFDNCAILELADTALTADVANASADAAIVAE